MAMATERSKLLHNFPLPYLKWGNQRLLRCMKYPPNIITTKFSPPLEPTTETPIRKRKLDEKSTDLRPLPSSKKSLPEVNAIGAKKLQVSVLEGGEEELAASKPWNLRTRRAACKVPQIYHPVEGREDVDGKKMGEVKFSVSLSKDEIEEDFVAAVGTRPPRRPKKRARVVQKQLDSLFPGLWLTEVTPDAYKVYDLPDSAKG